MKMMVSLFRTGSLLIGPKMLCSLLIVRLLASLIKLSPWVRLWGRMAGEESKQE